MGFVLVCGCFVVFFVLFCFVTDRHIGSVKYFQNLKSISHPTLKIAQYVFLKLPTVLFH